MLKLDRTIISAHDRDNHGAPKWFKSWEDMDKYYNDKSAIILATKPASCNNIGMRCGYLGWTYLKTIKNGHLHITDNTYNLAVRERDFADRFPFGTVEFHLAPELPCIEVDMTLFNPETKDPARLRGLLDYSLETTKRTIVICDFNYRHNKDLRNAVSPFLEDNKDRIKSSTVVSNYYGDLVIEKANGPS